MSTRTCSVPLPHSLLEERMIQREPVNRYTGRTAGLKNDQNKKTITSHHTKSPLTWLKKDGFFFWLSKDEETRIGNGVNDEDQTIIHTATVSLMPPTETGRCGREQVHCNGIVYGEMSDEVDAPGDSKRIGSMDSSHLRELRLPTTIS